MKRSAKKLVQFWRLCKYDDARTILTVHCSPTVKLECTVYSIAELNYRKSAELKNRYWTVLLDEPSQHCYVDMLENWSTIGCTEDPQLVLLSWNNYHFPAQAIKLSEIVKISNGILKSKEPFRIFLYSLLGYTQTFEETHGVCFFDVCLVEVIENLVSSNVLATSFEKNTIWYIIIDKMAIARKAAPPLVINLYRAAWMPRTLTTGPFDKHVLYSLFADDIFLTF